MENFLDEDEIYNEISEEESMEEYLHNHEPSYYLRWDDYQHARFLNPERFHEYELNNDIRNNHVEPDH